jgi:S-adenosylmethionine hydrolase
MMESLVTLLTDFGWDDPYVAEMKAALFDQWYRLPDSMPTPTIVDLCHTIPVCDVTAGSWFLERLHGKFPPGTTHVAVIDPGVGTERPVIAVAARDQFFVGPGNGLFSFLCDDRDLAVARLDDPRTYRSEGRYEPAPTFHGRDIMAPVAALLVLGTPIQRVGSQGSPEDIGHLPAVRTVPDVEGTPIGKVVWIDRFGNALTDIRRSGSVGNGLQQSGRMLIGTTEVVGPYRTFGEGPVGRPFWYWGSGGCLEAALAGENAAERYDWRIGLAVSLLGP